LKWPRLSDGGGRGGRGNNLQKKSRLFGKEKEPCMRGAGETKNLRGPLQKGNAQRRVPPGDKKSTTRNKIRGLRDID